MEVNKQPMQKEDSNDIANGRDEVYYKWVKASVPDNFPQSLKNAIFRDADTKIILSHTGYDYDNYTFTKVGSNESGKPSYELDEVEWLKPVTIPEQVTNEQDKSVWLEKWKKVRTDAITEMFDNPDEIGIYPTTKFFNTIDNWLLNNPLNH